MLADGIDAIVFLQPGSHAHFGLDGFLLPKTYQVKEKEMFEKIAATQPIGRMGSPEEKIA